MCFHHSTARLAPVSTPTTKREATQWLTLQQDEASDYHGGGGGADFITEINKHMKNGRKVSAAGSHTLSCSRLEIDR